MISDLPSSYSLWKERYFFVSSCNWEYDPLDKDETLGVPVTWTTPENLREYRFVLGIVFVRPSGISDSTLFACFSSAWPDLSPEDNVIAQGLDECSLHPYAELIRSDIPSPSSSRSIRSAALRPSPPSTMKISPIGISVAKPTKESFWHKWRCRLGSPGA